MRKNYHPRLEADCYYHVYNRTNNKELLFRNDKDRIVFLKLLVTYILPYADVFVYSLLGNHFHLLIKIKSWATVTELIENIPDHKRTITQKDFLLQSELEQSVAKVLESQFLRLFTSYVKKFNVVHCRNGSLFARQFKRIYINSEFHLIALVYYIHANAEKHGIAMDFRKYVWSSYQAMISNTRTNVNRVEVLRWFEGKAAFVEYHEQQRERSSELDGYLLE